MAQLIKPTSMNPFAFDWVTNTAAQSAQIKLPTVQPTPQIQGMATTNPTTTKASNTSKQPTYLVGGWYNGRQWDGQRFGNPGEVIVGGPGAQSTSQSVSSGMSTPAVNFDAIYNPLFENLNLQEQQLEGDFTDAKTEAEAAGEAQKKTLTTQKQGIDADIATQNSTVEKQAQSALAEAIRAYNALNQQRMSRFGMGSSASQAVGEIGQQQFFRNQGQIQTQESEQFEKIRTYSNQVQQFFLEQESKITKDVSDKIKELLKAKAQALMSISTNRNLLASQKAQAQTNISLQFQQAKQAVDDWKQQQQYALQIWKEQQDVQLKNQIELINAQKYTAQPITYTAGSTLTSPTTPSTSTVINANPNTSKKDELSGLSDFILKLSE